PVHVLHHGSGDLEDAQRSRVRACRRVRRRQHRGGLRGAPPGDRDGQEGAGAAMSVLVWAGVVVIGGAGSVLRFYVDAIVTAASGRDFPYGTLAVNLSGAVILGLIAGLALAGAAA